MSEFRRGEAGEREAAKWKKESDDSFFQNPVSGSDSKAVDQV